MHQQKKAKARTTTRPWIGLLAGTFMFGAFLVRFAPAEGLSLDAKAAATKAVAASRNLKPLPAPAQTPNVVPLSPAEQLGKDIFFDHTLSHPEGYACATCHLPQAGFTGPSSLVNRRAGPVPGVIPGRFGRRKPQAIPYATFSPEGPFLNGAEGGTFLGGQFWDGRTPNLAEQARMPFVDQNEMANRPAGPFPPHAGGFSPLVARKLRSRPYVKLFAKVAGPNVFRAATDQEFYELMTAALAAYEASAEVNPFSSRFDASKHGTPPQSRYTFTRAEENGRRLFLDKAQCFLCHISETLDPVTRATHGKEVFTMYCYANIGIPRNPGNPFYGQTDCDSNPNGCNPLGPDFVDFGLGANPNPAPNGRRFMIQTPGDIQRFRGLFKAPSLRNVAMRPHPGFVKSFMHNGVFKSLEEVVHFYNKRNIATNSAGAEMSFHLAVGAPAGFTAIFPPPEVLDNVQNIFGLTPDETAQLPPPADGSGPPVSLNGQVGNLQLTAQEEADIVSFVKTLTDGYIRPQR